MAFRGGVAPATVFDTRFDPSGAGVRVYTDNTDPAAPRGVVEFSDGFGDAPGQLVQHATANQRAQKATAGGGLTVVGGSYAGLPAPQLDLAVVQIDAGVYTTRATLTGAAGFALGDGYVPELTAPACMIGVPPADGWQPTIRAGTQVLTVNSASFAAVSWPAFPNGLVATWIVAGDIAGALGQVTPSAYRLSGADVRVLSASGGNLANGAAVRVNFLAIGW